MKTRFTINGRFLGQDITGVQRYSRELLNQFDELAGKNSSVEIELVVPKDTDVPALRNITIRRGGYGKGHFWEQLSLPFLTRGQALFCPGNTAPILSLIFGRVATTIHDLSFIYFPKSYSPLFRAAYNVLTPFIFMFAKVVITVSASEQTEIIKRYPWAVDRIVAIQNGGGEFASTDQSLVIPSDYILYVGSLTNRKNFPAMYETALRVSSISDVRFVFVGAVPQGLIGSQATAAEREGVTFLGQVNSIAELQQLYSRALCFFFPSLYEASPLPPIEAMSFGCPVVASNIPSLVERCADAALYCDPYSVDDMVEKLLDVTGNADLRGCMSSKGRERARLYTWNSSAAQTLSVLGRAFNAPNS